MTSPVETSELIKQLAGGDSKAEQNNEAIKGLLAIAAKAEEKMSQLSQDKADLQRQLDEANAEIKKSAEEKKLSDETLKEVKVLSDKLNEQEKDLHEKDAKIRKLTDSVTSAQRSAAAANAENQRVARALSRQVEPVTYFPVVSFTPQPPVFRPSRPNPGNSIMQKYGMR